MATLVLTTVGSLVGGPLGGAIGALIGQQVDNRLFAPKGNRGPRLGDLSVQTSSYGSPIAKIFGRLRVAGTVIWSTDIKEDRHRQSGGKGRPKTTTYSYSASFAVALSGRPIRRVERIWADGKLLRGAAGDFKTETGFRLHVGGEDQPRDPLIAAAEGVASTPAYRGLAYAVFEDFQLGDYGNRIPSLTFELVADEEGTTSGTIISEVSRGIVEAEAGASLTGFAAHGDNVRTILATLDSVAPKPLVDEGERLVLGSTAAPACVIPAGSELSGGGTHRAPAGHIPAAVEIGYYDPARDYQAGLQRASLGGPGGRVEQIAFPAALDAGAAKALAAAKLEHLWRTRERRTAVLPWKHVGIRAGRIVRFEADAAADREWLVTGWMLERMEVRLELRVLGGAASPSLPAGPGRAALQGDLVHGPTNLVLFDAPELGEAAATGPRLLIAAAGASAGWRGAMLEASSDGGASWQPLGATGHRAVIGTAATVLDAAGSTLFDLRGSVEVVLLSEEMWLESRDEDALVGGANLAMLGDEVIQFETAEPIGPRRFRLSCFLRGRRGTEWAAGAHAEGERFVLIEPDSLGIMSVPMAMVGGTAEIAARGVGDGPNPAIAAHVIGSEAVRPPSPVHLRAQRQAGGAIAFRWTRRSRTGWAWIDGVDAPVGEPTEAYRVTISGGVGQRVVEIDTPEFVYSRAAQDEDGLADEMQIVVTVEQIGGFAASRPDQLIFGAD